MNPDELQVVLQAVQANDGLCGRSMIAKILRGSRDARLLALGLDQSPGYGALRDRTLEQIGYLVDEVLALELIGMADAGWHRGRKRQEAHFPLLFLTDRGAEALAEGASSPTLAEADLSAPERARALAMRALVQGAYALEDYKHGRIEAADFVHESPGDHVVLFAMERHPRGERLLCLYRWDQPTNRVAEVESVNARRIRDLDQWFAERLRHYRRQ